MDAVTINAAFTGFKTAVDIIKKLIELKAFADHQVLLADLTGAVISAQGATLQFQAENAALISEKTNLEKELLRLKTWEAEKQRYELKEVGRNVFAYVLKESMRGGEPIHWICTNCYNDNVKSILQDFGTEIRDCPRCKHRICPSSAL